MEKKALRQLYQKYGEAVIYEPRKLRAHLLDMRLPKKSVNLLVDISKIDYFKQFAAEICDAPEAREKLAYAIENEYAFSMEAVEFGAACWEYAFTGKNSLQDALSDDGDVWPEEKAELVAAALRELMRDDDNA